jgi:hypothetical protein
MGVLLQGFYKTGPQHALPSPADGDSSIPWWWDHLGSQANELRQAGFTAVWLPPVLKNDTGADARADGYRPFDDYDIGSKPQKGSTPTRYGSRERLQRCVATLRANGLDVYVDMVEHQRIGDEQPFVFRYKGADGTNGIGRFRKDPPNFLPQVPRDPDLGGPPSQDIAFGRELAPINAKPHHYVFDNLIEAADWLTRGLDVQGYRVDDVKGLSTDFLLPFLNAKSMSQKFAVGEFFDGNPVLVNGWVFNPSGMGGRSSAFDFPLKFVLNGMCNNAGRFNMADLDHVGLTGISPIKSVTFVENHDTDTNPGQGIVFNKMMGYAYILTSEGYPCVYYRDYSTDRNCYGLKPFIDNLVWIHENLAAGPTEQRWKDFNVFAYERLGGPHLLVGLNNDPAGARTITVATGFGAHTPLHDYTGHAPDVTTDGNGTVTLTLPANHNGLGYVCYSREGLSAPIPVHSLSVTQDFDGDDDLDIPPVSNGVTVQAGRIWCASGSPIRLSLKIDRTHWTPDANVTLELQDPGGHTMASQVFTAKTPPDMSLHATATRSGFHALHLRAASLPHRSEPFRLSVTYTAPRTLADAPAASVAPRIAAVTPDPKVVGKWSDVIQMPNVPIHAHLLPTGKVLFWGRRKNHGSTDFDTLNEHRTFPFLWDPATPDKTVATKTQPKLGDGTDVNLFCSGHTFLADGRLLVIGGHLFDSQGSNQSCVYDPFHDTWTATQTMNDGRWYPTAVTLPDGSVLACSGTAATGQPRKPKNQNHPNTVQQIWSNGTWRSIVDFVGLPLFPRMHVAPDGRVFMSGGIAESFFLDTRGNGTWTPGPSRAAGNRDYAPSVMYDAGKVIFIGGGLDHDTFAPTNLVEIIDLNSADPQWRQTSPMHFARRQHNATLLPDGTVLVTGGTKGEGFDNLSGGSPVHEAELWNPATGEWTVMAAEGKDRCYHSTAVLLPDARVLSAGGGEYAPNDDPKDLDRANDPKDTHPDAQLFSPPYLFKGPRPTITEAPTTVKYGQAFDVQTPRPQDIESVSWIRLPSVTHSWDQNQRLNVLKFQAGTGKLSVTAPANGNLCPPGHYMLFILDRNRIPSVARIIQIGTGVAPAALQARVAEAAEVPRPKPFVAPNRRPVVVGITATCPYGLSACWGGAYQALTRLRGVEVVKDTPDGEDSTADVYLKHDGLPDIDLWPHEFARIANGTHPFRGVEVTLEGTVRADQGTLVLTGNETRPPVRLEPIQAAHKIQWDFATRARKPLEPAEQSAYDNLAAAARAGAGSTNAVITGPLLKTHTGFVLEVRRFN